MTVKETLSRTVQTLRKGSREPHLDAEVLLSFVLRKSKAWLYAHPEEKLKKNQGEKIKKLITRRLRGEPIAYITGHKEFFGLDFHVDKRVLVPCPETELLIEEILNSLPKPPSSIADVGTGSGNIAIALAKHLPKARIFAIDASKNALRVAQKNAKKHQVEKQIIFLAGNLCQPLPKKVDIIAANLPYIPTKQARLLKNRPLMSLDGGKDGLVYFKSLLKNASNHLKNNGQMFLEIDPGQATEIKKLVKRYLPGTGIKIKKDLAGLDRVVIISNH